MNRNGMVSETFHLHIELQALLSEEKSFLSCFVNSIIYSRTVRYLTRLDSMTSLFKFIVSFKHCVNSKINSDKIKSMLVVDY